MQTQMASGGLQPTLGMLALSIKQKKCGLLPQDVSEPEPFGWRELRPLGNGDTFQDTSRQGACASLTLRSERLTPNVWGVKLSVKSDYAARAVLGLARHYPRGAALRVEQLGAEQGVPPNYLVQILIELKSQGIVRSLRGKEGGYLLARPPAEITLADVLRAVHGTVFDSPALADANCPPELRRAWQRLQNAIEHVGGEIDFQKLLDESGEKEKMYYI